MQRILSLDDELEILYLLHTIFARAGYEHIYTTDTEYALHILHSQPIDLFTQDVMRPDINGYTLYQIMQQEADLKGIPILIITTQAPMVLMERSMELFNALYPNYYVAMPFTPRELLNKVKQILKD
ncbi:MAG: response regulator [Anaerolineae bacterium]|nr:response regulator [Anaerolineae bacterium]